MKIAAIATMIFVAGTALGSAAFAQGRHDENPHGMPKDMPMSMDGKEAPAPAGRHDEKPHGQKKAAKKPAAKAPKDNAGAK